MYILNILDYTFKCVADKWQFRLTTVWGENIRILYMIKKLIEELRMALQRVFRGFSASRAVIERGRSQIINATALLCCEVPLLSPTTLYRACIHSPPMPRPIPTTANFCSDCLFIYTAPNGQNWTTSDRSALISHVAANLYLHRAHWLKASEWANTRRVASEYLVSTQRVAGESTHRHKGYLKAILFS